MTKEFISSEYLENKGSCVGKIMPHVGDLIRLSDGAVVAIVEQCGGAGHVGELLAVWSDGSSAQLSEEWVNPVEILGKCVFGLYK